MSRLSQLEDELRRIQRRIDRVKRIPEDTFAVGTVLLFAATDGAEWHIRKTDEDRWSKVNVVRSNVEKDLSGWILEAEESGIGNFSIFELRPRNTPFYTFET